jgi:lysophospholipase L1-like esterase
MTPTYEWIEWDNAWMEQTGNHDARRVLYIGDSITVGTRGAVNAKAAGRVVFDNFGTSKALDNPYFFDSLRLFAAQQPSRMAVFFNNGLHGWHLSEEQYETLYAEMLDKLIENFGDVPVLPMLTTLSTSEHFPNARVEARNEIVRKLAAERGLTVIDLYAVACANREHIADGVHFNGEGYNALADELLRVVDEICP